MKWSQLKKRVEAFFADAVRGRVGIQTTRYHKAHDQMGRAWITLDGREVINMCSFKAEVALREEWRRLRHESRSADSTDPQKRSRYDAAYNRSKETLWADGIFHRYDFHEALFNYLNLPIETIITSPDPIIRAIGMLDRRVGLRRLAAADVASEHPLVRTLHAFRCEAERNVHRSGPRVSAMPGEWE